MLRRWPYPTNNKAFVVLADRLRAFYDSVSRRFYREPEDLLEQAEKRAAELDERADLRRRG
jgi:hypothetical protein